MTTYIKHMHNEQRKAGRLSYDFALKNLNGRNVEAWQNKQEKLQKRNLPRGGVFWRLIEIEIEAEFWRDYDAG